MISARGAFFVVLLSSLTAAAHNEELVTSTLTGSNAYLVVTRGQGPSQREPGLYVRDRSDWRPALLGAIESHPQLGPVLQQFTVSRIDRASQSLILIDGSLAIVSQFTDEAKPRSLLKIGSAEHPLIHPLTHQPLLLPKIEKVEQVTWSERQSSQSSLVALSVNYGPDHAMTFIMEIRAVNESGEMRLQRPIILVDAKVHNMDSLAQLLDKASEEGVPAPMVGRQYVRSVPNIEARFSDRFGVWASAMKDRESDNRVSWDLQSLTLAVTPSFTIREGSRTTSMVQKIDPIGSSRWIEFEGKKILSGTVDFNTLGRELITSTDRRDSEQAWLISVDSEVFIVTGKQRSQNRSIAENWSDFSIQYLTRRLVPGTNDRVRHYYLLSWRGRNTQGTGVYYLEFDENRNIADAGWGVQRLSNEYVSREELLRRVAIHSDRPFFMPVESREVGVERLLNAVDIFESHDRGQIERGVRVDVGRDYRLHLTEKGTTLSTIDGEPILKAIDIGTPDDIHVERLAGSDLVTQDCLIVVRLRNQDRKVARVHLYRAQRTNGVWRTKQLTVNGEEYGWLYGPNWKDRIQIVDRRFVIDLSEKKDGTRVFNIADSIDQRRWVEDNVVSQIEELRNRNSAMTKFLQEKFPGLEFELDERGYVKFAAIPQKVFQMSPALLQSVKDAKRFLGVSHQFLLEGQPASVVFLPFDSPTPVLLAFVRDGTGEAATWHPLQITPRSNADLNWVQAERYDDEFVVVPNSNGIDFDVFVTARRERYQRQQRSPNMQVQPEEPKQAYRIALKFNITSRLLELGSLQSMGEVGPTSNIDLHLATHADVGTLWIEGERPLDGRDLRLRVLSNDATIQPNIGLGRLDRPKIRYRVAPEDRATVAREVNEEFRFDGSWRAEGRVFADSIARSKAISPFVERIFRPVYEKLKAHLQRQGDFPIFVVTLPADVKPLFLSYLAQKLRDNGPNEPWSAANPAYQFFTPSSDPKQGQVVDNLEVISRFNSPHNVFFAKIETLRASVRPRDRSNLYSTTTVTADTHSGIGPGEVSTQRETEFPPWLFLLASQGDTSLTYESIADIHPRLRFPSILVGTPAEWSDFYDNNNRFAAYGADKWLDIVEFENPSVELRVEMLESVLRNPELRSTEIQFDASGIIRKQEGENDQGRAMTALLRFAVQRLEKLSPTVDKEPLTVFFDYLVNLSKALLGEANKGSKIVISRAFIENTLSRMFDTVLDRNNLAPDDPDFIMTQPDAAIRLREHGYTGPPMFLKRILRALTAHLSPGETLKMPSSFWLAGDSGSGKSFLYEVLVKWLKLQEYDMNLKVHGGNNEARAFRFRCEKITDSSENAVAGTMDVEQVIAHFEHFMSLNGYRGIVLVDDLHEAPPAARLRLLKYFRGLQESKNGVHTIQTKEVRYLSGVTEKTEEVSRPVRQLKLMITMNFTQNQESIRRFVKNNEKPTLEQMMFATLSSPGHDLEDSTFNRYGDRIPLSSFSPDAKSVGLVKEFREKQQNLLELRNRLVILDPMIVRELVRVFPTQDARTFFKQSTDGLYSVAEGIGGDVGAMVLTANPSVKPVVENPGNNYSVSQESQRMQKVVRELTQALPIPTGYDGKLQLTWVLMNSFRISIFERFFAGLQEHPLFIENDDLQRDYLFPVLQALYDHLMSEMGQPILLPLTELRLDPSLFDLKQKEDIERFQNAVAEVGPYRTNRYFPVSFSPPVQNTAFLELTSTRMAPRVAPNRRGVLHAFLQKLTPLISEELAVQSRLSSPRQFPKVENWFQALSKDEPGGERVLQEQLVTHLIEFKRALFADNLIEMMQPTEANRLASYDVARLYIYAIEKAIVSLDWGRLTQFLSRVLETAAEDMTLSQGAGFQQLFKNSQRSILNIRMAENLASNILNLPAFEDDSKAVRESQQGRFLQTCDHLLVREKKR